MTQNLRSRFVVWMILTAWYVTAGQSLSADLLWEGHFNDEDAIVNGSSVFADSTTMTFSTTVFSDSDGGTFDLSPVRSASFFSFESGVTGNHQGYLEMTLDNENNDPVDYIQLDIDFQNPVANLQFSLLDIDGSSAFAWDDGVEVFFNGVNVKTNSSLFRFGSAVFLDNESYMDGFEAGTRSASANQTIGNIDFDFTSFLVNDISIRYLSTDDAIANPASQFIGISDLDFAATTVPEPASSGLFMLGMCCILCARRRTGRSPVA